MHINTAKKILMITLKFTLSPINKNIIDIKEPAK